MMGILRWMRRRLRCKTVLLTLAALIFCAFYYMYVTNTCSETKSRQFITDLCDKYHSNEVAGSFCGKLCDSRGLKYESCTNYPRGKVVIFMTCDGCESDKTSRVVLKSRSRTDEEELFLINRPPPFPKSEDEASWKDYYDLIQTIVRHYFSDEFNDSVSQHQDVVSFAWGLDFYQFIANSKFDRQYSIQLTYRSIMSLLQQSEYLLSRYLQGRSYIPRIYGTCGNAYFVEYTETLYKYEFNLGFRESSSWYERAEISLLLIDLFRRLEGDFKRPLHLCDVKPDNFGKLKGDNTRVTIIDTDSVFFEEQLMRQFLYSNCTSHEDCDFFDCRGYCDVTAGRCKLERTNNNMQTLCEDVFQGFSPKLPSGLLRGPPKDIEEDLYDALQECAYPDNLLVRHTARQRTPEIAVKKLEELLKFALKYRLDK